MPRSLSRATLAFASSLSLSFSIPIAGCALAGCNELARERMELAGRHIFFDEHLSARSNQACAACHALAAGGTGPDEAGNAGGAVYEGSIAGRFGNRKPPSSSYAMLSPRFFYSAEDGFGGGNFWDGRATGWKLGTAVADQAQGPFLNPLEQALSSSDDVVARICAAPYAPLFRAAFGKKVCAPAHRTEAWNDTARAIAIWEGGHESSPFSSKYDAVQHGEAAFDTQEKLGLTLFEGKANCARCHSTAPTSVVVDGETYVAPTAFSDFTFENIGAPRNPDNPFYGMDAVVIDGQPVNPLGSAWVDLGLAVFVEQLATTNDWRALPAVTEPLKSMSAGDIAALAPAQRGKFRVPTLRNVDKRPTPTFVKAYGHNGYFKSLAALVHFYNTRDVLPRCATSLREADALTQGCWPAPEVEATINTSQLGNLGLSQAEEAALVAFLATLSDGFAH